MFPRAAAATLADGISAASASMRGPCELQATTPLTIRSVIPAARMKEDRFRISRMDLSKWNFDCWTQEGRTRSQTENAYRCIRPLNLIECFRIGYRGIARPEPGGDERSRFLSEGDGEAGIGLRVAPSGLIIAGSIRWGSATE